MNPDSGKLHGVVGSMLTGDASQREGEALGEVLARAKPIPGEPPPGIPVPEGWPVFVEGQELRPIKGWKSIIHGVDLEMQVLLVRLEKR